MRRIDRDLIDVLKWVGFAPWSLFWMSAAIGYGLIFRKDPHTPLSWARRYWSPGAAVISGCELTQHAGFVPQPGKPYIFMMNHQSMFDIVCAFIHVPVNLRFIAKKILQSIPFLGWYMTVTGMIFVDRRNREQALQSLQDACDKIRSGIPILVYPEGTRSKDGTILPFKKGPFMFALQAGVPIVPVAINGSINILLPGSPFVRPGKVDIVMGQPIPTEGLTVQDRDALMQRVRDAIIDLHVQIGGKGGDKAQVLAAEGKEGVSVTESE
ncbi:MAG: lysophospholipid acyltransferase family protein [Polyangia bacterium]|jgi:1-acyl-sn-glycerol-3-phosphate acyltransferase